MGLTAEQVLSGPTEEQVKLAAKETTLTTNDLEIFAYHLSVLYRETGKFGLSRPDGAVVEGTITPTRTSAASGDDVWDGVVMNGHSVGNRHGAAKAYARFWAGEAEWWRPR